MAWLIDTNVLSEPSRLQPNAKVLNWLGQHAAAGYISTISLGEIWKGIQLLPFRRRSNFESWYLQQEEVFEGRFLAADDKVMKTWGSYYAEYQKQGRLLGVTDSIIAATALAHDLTLATRNTADFPGVRTVNPWRK